MSTTFTQFMDMHSGGGLKEGPYQHIYIQAPKEEAKIIFYNRFKHNPERVTCTCCGADYSISEYETLEQATGFERHCDYEKGVGYVERPDNSYGLGRPVTPLSDYLKGKDVLVIYEADIKPEERTGEIPEQGYVWVD